MELQALRLRRGALRDLCRTKLRGRRARSSHGALHGALGQYFDVPNHSRGKPNQEGGSSRPS
jgi:hypothetical protein